jgi:hypothetical protein
MHLLRYVLLLSVALVLLSACQPSQTQAPAPQAPIDFIAGDSNLTDLLSWKRFATLVGKQGDNVASLGGTTHRSHDTNLVRIIFAKNNVVPMVRDAAGKYPVGTMLVKLYRRRTPDSTILGGTMMVKRGGEFARLNPSGWEWITLTTTGTIGQRARSDSTARTACVGCHEGKSTSNDFLFTLLR